MNCCFGQKEKRKKHDEGEEEKNIFIHNKRCMSFDTTSTHPSLLRRDLKLFLFEKKFALPFCDSLIYFMVKMLFSLRKLFLHIIFH